jgi:gentisate 1,2-dioxygenase
MDFLQVTYINPETGLDAENILGFYAMMIRPSQKVTLPVRSPAMVFHMIEGESVVKIDQHTYQMGQADTCCAPGYTPIEITNPSSSHPCFIFITDETPLHKKLGVFENRTQRAK